MTTSTDDAAARSEGRVWQLTAVMAVAGAAMAAVSSVDVTTIEDLRPGVVWWLLLPLFALAEVVVIHLPAQRSSHSHTLREIPAIAGLTFLAPHEYVTAYVIGGGLALLLWSRQRGLKLCFNVSMFTLEAALGSAAYHWVLGSGDPIEPRAWAAAAAAVLVTDLVSAAAVTAAISLTESTFDGQVLREALTSGVAAALVNACVALLLVTLVVARPSALPLLGTIVVLLVLGYRVYVSLARRHAQMRLLYEFVGSTGRTAEPEEVVPAVLSEAAHLLHASSAQLVTLGADGRPAVSWSWRDGVVVRSEAPPPDSTGPTPWWAAAIHGEPVLLRSAAAAGVADARDGIAVPLMEDDGVSAVLVVQDRAFEEETFSESDLQVFETLAAHAAVALDKARVVERLRRVAEERAHEALHDQLTGLPNRRAFLQAVETAMGTEDPCAVLLLDLDDFRDVNDTLGHGAGDSLLRVTGRRLLDADLGMVARLGGDEFAVLLRGVDDAGALAAAASLRTVVNEPVPITDAQLVATVSVGVAGVQGRARSADEVLGEADVAMHSAKAARSGVEAYRPEDGHRTARRLRLAHDLPTALADGALELWFQPQARCRDGEVTGFETLLRWNHPDLGMVPAPELVAVAQRTGQMRALTDSIVARALHARAEWARAGHDLDVAVNVTAGDVADPTLVERVDAALTVTATPPGALVLEVTESDALGDPQQVIEVLEAVAARGVRLSVDDFGTGYSSLAYLDRLPVHEVKIDQSFVLRLEKAESDSTIVRATVALAHDLGLRVVTEGVESELARSMVTEMGADLYQGYGLGRPMPQSDVLPWLRRRSVHRSRSLASPTR